MTTARMIAVGNSRGIRLSKQVLATSGLDGEVEVHARPGEVLIRALRQPRAGWDEAFALMAARGDDQLLDVDLTAQSAFDDDWQW